MYSVFYRCDDPVEDDKEKKELGCLTIENGIAPNHGLVFFVCVCCFLICCSESVCVCIAIRYFKGYIIMSINTLVKDGEVLESVTEFGSI